MLSAPTLSVETLAGAYHPHAIEVQEFSHYALVIDVRPLSAFEEDHIPGAVQLTPPEVPASSVQDDGATAPIPAGLATVVAKIKPDRAILLYCGRGGLDSLPLAKSLRWRGWTVDVLPGGWINYRRWVEAGLEVLPRLVSFRVIASPLGAEMARVVRTMQDLGQQVVDIEGIAGWRRGALFGPTRVQPSQAGFESLLLQALRRLDPRRPVWVGDVGRHLGSVSVSGALFDAVSSAPFAYLNVDRSERLRCWKEDEGFLLKDSRELVRALEELSPRPADILLANWKDGVAAGQLDAVLESVLQDYLGDHYSDQSIARSRRRGRFPTLVVNTLAATELESELQTWLSELAAS